MDDNINNEKDQVVSQMESLDFKIPRLYLLIDKEKIQEKGEDACPLLSFYNNRGWLGVFDGLGGAGAATFEYQGKTCSGAYIASRLVREACLHQLQLRDNIDKDFLSNGLLKRLQEENHKQRLELLQAHADLHQLKHDYNQLHTAHTILLGDDATDEDRVKAKQRITNIILQVDKAIEALTQ